MSLSSVRSYFRTVMDGLGYEEWTDGFNVENIPQTIKDRTYHLETGFIDSGPANQLTHQFDYSITVRAFFKGYNEPAAAIDLAILASEGILAVALDPANRLGLSIKDISPGSIQVQPRDFTNDNDVVLIMEFNADIICDFS